MNAGSQNRWKSSLLSPAVDRALEVSCTLSRLFVRPEIRLLRVHLAVHCLAKQ